MRHKLRVPRPSRRSSIIPWKVLPRSRPIYPGLPRIAEVGCGPPDQRLVQADVYRDYPSAGSCHRRIEWVGVCRPNSRITHWRSMSCGSSRPSFMLF